MDAFEESLVAETIRRYGQVASTEEGDRLISDFSYRDLGDFSKVQSFRTINRCPSLRTEVS